MPVESGKEVITVHRPRLDEYLGIAPESKPNVYAQLSAAAEISNLNYWMEIFLSAGIATLGLVQNSPAVIIGAMLISPLMGPILAAGMALAVGDLFLSLKSLLNILASMAAAIAFSAAVVWMLPFHVPTTEILNRTSPNLLDLGIAVFSGLAGAVAIARAGSGLGATALPGVAIAVALMPPLCTVGFGVGAGMRWNIINGANLLFLTNLTAIIASSFAVFLLIRLDAPESRGEITRTMEKQYSGDRLYRLLDGTVLAGALAGVGKLRYRALVLLAALGFIIVPLSRALTQVKDQTSARSAAREAIRLLGPRDSVLAENIDSDPGYIRVHVILTDPVTPAAIAEARQLLAQRTGRKVDLVVRQMARQDAVAMLQERLAPPPPSKQQETPVELQENLLARVNEPLKELWPAAAGELTGFALTLAPQKTTVHISYQGSKPLSPDTLDVLRNALKAKLGLDNIEVEAQPVPK